MTLLLLWHGRVWRSRQRGAFVPAVTCSVKAGVTASPVFCSCIWSTWIIKPLAGPAEGLSQNRATDRRHQCSVFASLPFSFSPSHTSHAHCVILSPSVSSAHSSFFIQFSFRIFILPPWWNHRWFKIHTYVANRRTQTSVQTIFKLVLEHLRHQGEEEKVKVGQIWACSISWNETGKTPWFRMTSCPDEKTHQCCERNLLRLDFLSLPLQSWISDSQQRLHWLDEIYSAAAFPPIATTSLLWQLTSRCDNLQSGFY